ncbi:MAG TPA: hypothetical protein VFE96_02515 [Candidatus Bathyarchaeia archaeon]|nr:hypothetical protein [Candidatus Bathyarchaeia archaeon]
MISRESRNAFRIRLGAISLVLSGLFFVLFPAVRPFFDETSLQGAKEFASTQWVLAHTFGIVGFILLGLGFLGIYIRLEETEVERWAFRSLVLSWIGMGLTLPFFGAEAFSLQVIGQTIVNQNNPALIPLINQVRYGPGIIFIGIGLVLLAAATILQAFAIWRSGVLPRWSGVPLAIGFAVYIPQLQGDPIFQPIRIVVALVIFLGCAWIAWSLLSKSK